MPVRRWTLLELPAHALAQLGVEIRQRLVQQQDRGLHHQAPGQRHPLLLAAAQLARIARVEPGQVDQLQHARDPGANLRARDAPHIQAEGDVVVHALVGPHRVVLEHHPHAAPLGRHHAGRRGERDRADPDGALVGRHEPGDQAEQRRLAAAARAQQRHELVVLDLQAQRADGHRVAEPLGDPLDGNRRHQAAGQPITAPRQRPRPEGSSPRRGQGGWRARWPR